MQASEAEIGMTQALVARQPRGPVAHHEGPRTAPPPRSATERALRAFCSMSSTASPRSAVSVLEARHDLGQNHRGQPERGLVEQQHRGSRSKRAADGEHLPLATGKAEGRRRAPRGQRRKQLVRFRRAATTLAARSRRQRPPRRRFSSTVSSLMTPCPSGTCATPIRAMDSGGRPVKRRSSSSTCPDRGLTSPEMVRTSVVFPAPLAPSTAVIVASATVSDTSSSAHGT